MKITHLPFDGNFKVTWKYGATGDFAGTEDNKHHGIDLVGITSKDVYSTCEGKVAFAGYDPSGFGNYVKVIDSTGLAHYFAHLASINVNVGQTVSYTTKLGVMGATGNVTGPHLHYEIRQNGVHIDPTPYMRIPNVEGTYSAKNYLIEIGTSTPAQSIQPVQVASAPAHKHRVGELVRYSTAYREPNGTKYCVLNPWQRQYISAIIPGARQPYRLKNGWYVNDGDIRN